MDRKYYRARCCRIQYEWANYATFKFMRTENKFYEMLLYEENGKFYELLTGKFLGERKKLDGRGTWNTYIYSDEFGYTIPLEGYSEIHYAYPQTAEAFANAAKYYMEDKDEIIPHINKCFDEWREKDRKKLEEENRKKRAENEAESWLDNMLKNRK